MRESFLERGCENHSGLGGTGLAKKKQKVSEAQTKKHATEISIGRP
jgi:hypothetical protein